MAQQRTQIGAPIDNFRLPVFGVDGNRIWELKGDQGVYQQEGVIDVKRMTLRTFAPGNPKTPELVIESPTARIFAEENRATGDGYLYLTPTDGSYAIVGRQWEWRGDDGTITIGEEAQVTFQQALGSILE